MSFPNSPFLSHHAVIYFTLQAYIYLLLQKKKDYGTQSAGETKAYIYVFPKSPI